MGNLALSASLGLDAFEMPPLELRPEATEADLQEVIAAVYRQVLGNVFVMDDQRLASAEALLRNGDLTVKEFVRAVAQSDLYRGLFFEGSSAYQFIELNCKHLLGRAPRDQGEIAEHVARYNSEGYEADINSYIDSDEYDANFGENTVPGPRGICSQVGGTNADFTRMFSLLRGSPTSDRGQSARLISSLGANLATAIKFPAKGKAGTPGNTGKRFKISYNSSQAAARLSGRSTGSCTVTYDVMSQTVQNIHRAGSRIVSIEEVT